MQNISPRWIVYLLSGTYWRIWGHPQNAVHCYRHSLARVPQEYKHVVLTNLAGLLFSTETIDDALTVMQDSIELEPKDPDSNFFIANLYVIKVSLYVYMVSIMQYNIKRPQVYLSYINFPGKLNRCYPSLSKYVKNEA